MNIEKEEIKEKNEEIQTKEDIDATNYLIKSESKIQENLSILRNFTNFLNFILRIGKR